MKKIIIMLLILSIAVPAAANLPDPMETLKKPINQVISILKDPKYDVSDMAGEQRDAIWDIVSKIFDFEKIGQLALGRYRREFSEKQMEDYINAFSRLMADTYIDRVQEEFTNEEVLYTGKEVDTEKNISMVHTKIIRQGNLEIPVEYKMYVKDGQWRVYDVIVEEVSLVKNYRTQFQEALFDGTPDELIKDLNEKAEKAKQKASGADGNNTSEPEDNDKSNNG